MKTTPLTNYPARGMGDYRARRRLIRGEKPLRDRLSEPFRDLRKAGLVRGRCDALAISGLIGYLYCMAGEAVEERCGMEWPTYARYVSKGSIIYHEVSVGGKDALMRPTNASRHHANM